jgi:hypothetical protein
MTQRFDYTTSGRHRMTSCILPYPSLAPLLTRHCTHTLSYLKYRHETSTRGLADFLSGILRRFYPLSTVRITHSRIGSWMWMADWRRHWDKPPCPPIHVTSCGSTKNAWSNFGRTWQISNADIPKYDQRWYLEFSRQSLWLKSPMEFYEELG